MFSEELNKLIEAALVDGVITDKERAVILKRAKAEGADLDEVELLLDAEVQKRTNTSSSTSKQTTISDNAIKELDAQISNVKDNKKIAQVISSFPVPSTKEELLLFIPSMETKWLHTSTDGDYDDIKTACKIKYKESLSKAKVLYGSDPDFHKLFQKEKSLSKYFHLNRLSNNQKFGCIFGCIWGALAIILVCYSILPEINNGNIKLSKIFKFGGYDSYQEAARAYDFEAAHKILDGLQEDYSSEENSTERKKKKETYDRACDDLFKSEALFLCAKGDKESIDRVVFLLSGFPIEGNALPEGTKYTSNLDFDFLPDEDDSRTTKHNLFIYSVRRFNNACNTLIDLSIAQHNYSIAEKVLPLYKSVPFPIEDFETDIEATKKAGETIYKKHEMKYSLIEKESAIEKINKAIDEGVFPNVTEHIK